MNPLNATRESRSDLALSRALDPRIFVGAHRLQLLFQALCSDLTLLIALPSPLPYIPHKMTAAEAKKHSKKRKTAPEEEAPAPAPTPFPEEVGLEMGSEDEGEDEDVASDDGEVEEFPEIDARSDTDDEDYEAAEESEDDEEDEDDEAGEDEDSEDTSDDDLGIFPKAKTVISDITGQPKRVYPEIEPNYDSDSSTEDVRDLIHGVSFSLMFNNNSAYHRHLTASGISQCIGTTIYPM